MSSCGAAKVLYSNVYLLPTHGACPTNATDTRCGLGIAALGSVSLLPNYDCLFA
jgi:hypothetical protein